VSVTNELEEATLNNSVEEQAGDHLKGLDLPSPLLDPLGGKGAPDDDDDDDDMLDENDEDNVVISHGDLYDDDDMDDDDDEDFEEGSDVKADVHDDYNDISNEKLDETYLKKIHKKKKFSDAETELQGLNPMTGMLPVATKIRKMAARTSASIEDHHGFLEKYFALMEGTREVLKVDLDAKSDALKGMQDQPEDKAKEVQDMQAEYDEATNRAKDLNNWRSPVSKWAEYSHEVSLDALEFEKDVKDGKDSTTELARFGELQKKAKLGFVRRKKARELQQKGDQSRKWAKKAKYMKKYIDGRAKRWSKKGGAMLGNMILGAATGGVVKIEARRVDGGRKTKLGVQMFSYANKFADTFVEAKDLAASRAMGGKKASMIYAILKMLSEAVLPMVASVASSVAFWATILGAPTIGGSLPLAGLAGAIALSALALKTLIDIIMVIWAAVRKAQTKDKDARKNNLAKSELQKGGYALAGDLISVGAAGAIASDGAGNLMNPGDAIKERVSNLAPQDIQFGSAGYTDNVNTGSEFADGLAQNADDVGKMAQYGNKAVLEHVKWQKRKAKGGGILQSKNRNAYRGKHTFATLGLSKKDQKFRPDVTDVMGGDHTHKRVDNLKMAQQNADNYYGKKDTKGVQYVDESDDYGDESGIDTGKIGSKMGSAGSKFSGLNKKMGKVNTKMNALIKKAQPNMKDDGDSFDDALAAVKGNDAFYKTMTQMDGVNLFSVDD